MAINNEKHSYFHYWLLDSIRLKLSSVSSLSIFLTALLFLTSSLTTTRWRYRSVKIEKLSLFFIFFKRATIFLKVIIMMTKKFRRVAVFHSPLNSNPTFSTLVHSLIHIDLTVNGRHRFEPLPISHVPIRLDDALIATCDTGRRHRRGLDCEHDVR